MDEFQCCDFQSAVSHYLLRNQSVLEILGKCQENSSRVNGAVVRAANSCGCIEIRTSKPSIPEDIDLEGLRALLSSQVQGQLCPTCREVLMEEIGRNLFYLTALCNVFDLSLQEVLSMETKKLETLGKYNLY